MLGAWTPGSSSCSSWSSRSWPRRSSLRAGGALASGRRSPARAPGVRDDEPRAPGRGPERATRRSGSPRPSARASSSSIRTCASGRRTPLPPSCWAGRRARSSAARSWRRSWIPKSRPSCGRRCDAARGHARSARRARMGRPSPCGRDASIGGGAWLVPRRRVRAATPAADPGRVHRQPLARAADAAHDRQPAGRDAVAGSATGGRSRAPRMRDRIAKIEVETGHLVQMVNELLDLSRIESGGTLAAGRRRRPGARWRRTRRNGCGCSPSARASTCTSTSSPDLPTVRGDAARLGQVVVNLVHNAVKFSPDGGIVTVRAARRWGDDVVVARRGPRRRHPAGRPGPRVRALLQGRPRAPAPEAGGGTGLGLAIARHVIEQHGGRIWVDSGGGSSARRSGSPCPSPPARDPDPLEPPRRSPWTVCTSRRSTS